MKGLIKSLLKNDTRLDELLGYKEGKEEECWVKGFNQKGGFKLNKI